MYVLAGLLQFSRCLGLCPTNALPQPCSQAVFIFCMWYALIFQKRLTGEDDLAAVTFLELSVNTADQSVAQVGELCPNLMQLKLNNSFLQSIRDLGTAVRNLQVLWLSRCGVSDLDGISVLDGLTELYLSFNTVEDITPLSLHDHLEVSMMTAVGAFVQHAIMLRACIVVRCWTWKAIKYQAWINWMRWAHACACTLCA